MRIGKPVFKPDKAIVSTRPTYVADAGEVINSPDKVCKGEKKTNRSSSRKPKVYFKAPKPSTTINIPYNGATMIQWSDAI